MIDPADYWDEATFCWLQRRHAADAPNYSRRRFHDLDERLQAQVDALALHVEAGWRPPLPAAGSKDPAELFVAALLALQADAATIGAGPFAAPVRPDGLDGIAAALAWAPPSAALPRIAALERRATPLDRFLAVAGCTAHRVEPGAGWAVHAQSPSARVRAAALDGLEALGRVDLLPLAREALSDPSERVRAHAARAAVRLGDRGHALDSLVATACRGGPFRHDAWRLALVALDGRAGHDLLMRGGACDDPLRTRVIGCGLVGDARYVPWLIEQMRRPALARVAAEAFVAITGADFNLDRLEAMPPDGHEDGPDDDPDHDSVDVPEDVALPWPDVARVEAWWHGRQPVLAPGTKRFLGRPVEAAGCLDVLRHGLQRVRVLAAQHLSLLQPAQVRFPVAAPAWRQARLLDAMP